MSGVTETGGTQEILETIGTEETTCLVTDRSRYDIEHLGTLDPVGHRGEQLSESHRLTMPTGERSRTSHVPGDNEAGHSSPRSAASVPPSMYTTEPQKKLA